MCSKQLSMFSDDVPDQDLSEINKRKKTTGPLAPKPGSPAGAAHQEPKQEIGQEIKQEEALKPVEKIHPFEEAVEHGEKKIQAQNFSYSENLTENESDGEALFENQLTE